LQHVLIYQIHDQINSLPYTYINGLGHFLLPNTKYNITFPIVFLFLLYASHVLAERCLFYYTLLPDNAVIMLMSWKESLRQPNRIERNRDEDEWGKTRQI